MTLPTMMPPTISDTRTSAIGAALNRIGTGVAHHEAAHAKTGKTRLLYRNFHRKTPAAAIINASSTVTTRRPYGIRSSMASAASFREMPETFTLQPSCSWGKGYAPSSRIHSRVDGAGAGALSVAFRPPQDAQHRRALGTPG